MNFTDHTLPTPEENLLYDDQLLKAADQGEGGEVLRFWESSKIFIVLGRTGKEEEEVIQEAVRRDHIPVLRRSSGGGTVVQGPGCLNFSLILAKDREPGMGDIRKSYQIILQKLITVLRECGTPAVFRPTSDLAVEGTEKKFSGNAQRRGRTHILHHGTILHNFDLPLIWKYLQMPKDIPEYRRNRPHNNFVTNIQLDIPQFKQTLEKRFMPSI